jgi:hypothetical protein
VLAAAPSPDGVADAAADAAVETAVGPDDLRARREQRPSVWVTQHGSQQQGERGASSRCVGHRRQAPDEFLHAFGSRDVLSAE